MPMFNFYDDNTKILTKSEYKKFNEFIDNHYEEFYTNKWGHEVFYHGDKFFVTNHSDYTFEEMLGGNNEQRS